MMKHEFFDWTAAELFLAVCEAGGITAAVRTGMAGMGQPALSARMRDLEASLGQTLFERKPFRTTPAGRVFLEECRALRRRMRAALGRMRDDEGGVLRVAASDVVIHRHLPALLAAMRMPASARLLLRDAPSHRLPQLVRDGEVDVAVGVMSERAARGVTPLAEVLMRVPLGVLVRAKGPVAADWKSLQGLLRAGRAPGLVGLPEDNLISEHFAAAMHRKGLRWPVTVEVSSMRHVATYVSLGLGCGLHLADPAAPLPKGLAWIPLPRTVVAPLAIGLWHRADPPALARGFIAAARRHARELGP